MGEKEEMVMEPISRRGFLKRSAVLSAALGATAIGGSLLTGCGPQGVSGVSLDNDMKRTHSGMEALSSP